MSKIPDLAAFVSTHHGINDKDKLAKLIVEKFTLTKDRKVYYCEDFAIRFSKGSNPTFSNTVLSLSNLKKVDHIPFLVCLVTPDFNHLFLANSTFLRKISHSSHALRIDNIKGSFNGSDIVRVFEGISNEPNNIEQLFDIHREIGFEENLPRLVEATNNIAATGHKFDITPEAHAQIMDAPKRATRFMASAEAVILKRELDERVRHLKNEILVAAMNGNVNVRGRMIEYLISGEDGTQRQQLIAALQNRDTAKGLPAFKTNNTLGDHQRIFGEYITATDVKSKMMVLSSNPKAYNLDKILKFLAHEKSVFLFYFVGVDPAGSVRTVLTSMFQTDLLNSTTTRNQWSGRNSRGVSQFEGKTIENLIQNPNPGIDEEKAKEFLLKIIAL